MTPRRDEAKQLDITLNVPAAMMAAIVSDPRQGWSRFCWETYGRYVGPKTKATIHLNVMEPERPDTHPELLEAVAQEIHH